MKDTYVIIGGGVAGLCAAIRLTELGCQPTLIESGSYPSHKICGEFLSPECLDILNTWGIPTHAISKIRVSTPSKSLDYLLQKPAGGISHAVFDPLLAQKAMAQGAKIYTNCPVTKLEFQGGEHHIHLAGGEVIPATHLLIAAGRLPLSQQPAAPLIYKGIKAHFSGIPVQDSLEMFAFRHAYLGISPISAECCNVACLASLKEFERFATAEDFIAHLMPQNSRLEAYLTQGKNLFGSWMTASVPAFGKKVSPPWPNTYAIGDAAGTIPPATGFGLSMAITGGIIAAEYAFKCDPSGYQRAWQSHFHTPICYGKILHQVMLHPKVANCIISLAHLFPLLSTQIYKSTRAP